MSKAPLASAQLIPCQNPNPMSEPRLSSVHAALACGPPARKHTLTVSIKEARGHGRHVKRGIILGVAALVLGLLGFWACWTSGPAGLLGLLGFNVLASVFGTIAKVLFFPLSVHCGRARDFGGHDQQKAPPRPPDRPTLTHSETKSVRQEGTAAFTPRVGRLTSRRNIP
jgi:hypothetical protein